MSEPDPPFTLAWRGYEPSRGRQHAERVAGPARAGPRPEPAARGESSRPPRTAQLAAQEVPAEPAVAVGARVARRPRRAGRPDPRAGRGRGGAHAGRRSREHVEGAHKQAEQAAVARARLRGPSTPRAPPRRRGRGGADRGGRPPGGRARSATAPNGTPPPDGRRRRRSTSSSGPRPRRGRRRLRGHPRRAPAAHHRGVPGAAGRDPRPARGGACPAQPSVRGAAELEQA